MAGNSFARPSIGSAVDTYCASRGVQPFNGDCNLCHANSTNYDHALSGDYDWFCPEPACTDNDGDTFAIEGGNCGPIDCDDTDAAINPAAAENCTDGFDNNCNGLIDAQDPAAVGCLVCTDRDGDSYAVEGGDCGPVDCNDRNAAVNPGAADICSDNIDNNCNGIVDENCAPNCTDNDGDTYALEGGACGPVDCDDTDATVHPGSVESCTDGIDNNCNGLVDALDPNAVNCPPNCTDNDGDTYAVEGGACGPVDCNDSNAAVNPGHEEFCGDAIDNDCDGLIDEGCDVSCPDVDGDGYTDAACGGFDCDDNNAAINPGAQEVCGNGIDENCNGSSDDECIACPDGTMLSINKVEYDSNTAVLKVSGRATIGSTITVINTMTDETLAENIPVVGGKWAAEINVTTGDINQISATNSDGCTSEKSVRVRKSGRGGRSNK